MNELEIYLVGGCVRDSILKKIPKDFDLVTNAVPEKVISLLKDEDFVMNIIETGKAFGVVNVITASNEYEIATFRSDGNYSDGRRPDSVIFGDIVDDSKRRDLTMNALFYDIDKKIIVDLVGGYHDILRGVVRTVGSPVERFKEDKLRKMRAARFAARFGSDLERETHMALLEDSNMHGVSFERIRDEFLKGIQSAKSVTHFMRLLDTYNFFPWIFKDLTINKNFIEHRDVLVILAVLLKHNDTKLVAKRLSELKYHPEMFSVLFLMSLKRLSVETAVALKRSQQHSGVSGDQMRLFGRLEGFDMNLLEGFIKFGFTVDGEDVMREFNLKPGKEVGDKIYQLETERFITHIN